MRHLPLHQNKIAYSVPTATVPHTHQTPADAKTKEPTL
jgi:hypothetical protein